MDTKQETSGAVLDGQPQPILTISVPGENPKEFFKVEEVEDWIKQEQAFWSWLQTAQQDFRLAEITKHMTRTFQELTSQIDQFKHNQLRNNNFQRTITATIDSRRYIVSTTERAKYLETLRKQDVKHAAFTLGSFLQIPIPHDGVSREWVKGIFEAELFERAVGGQNLQAQRLQFQQFFSESQSQFHEFDGKLAQSAKQHDALVTQLRESLASQDQALTGALTKTEEELKAIKKTYDEFLALQAPVNYWRDGSSEHRRNKRYFGTLALGFGFLSAFLILLTIWYIFPSELPAGISDAAKSWLLFRCSATLLIEATMAVWITRLLVRVYLSNLHLESDAKERVVMTETYLALLRSSQAFTQEERSIILNQLFRHAATGVVKDDSAPPHPIEILTRPYPIEIVKRP